MFGKYPLAEVGALLADPSRVAMLTVVLDGHHHSAGELAMAAGVSPQAASAHLAKLTAGGLLKVHRIGRRRMFALARPEVGHALESLGAMAGRAPCRGRRRRPTRRCGSRAPVTTTWRDRWRSASRAVWWPKASCGRRGADYHVSTAGARWLGELEIDLTVIRSHRRQLARQCLDWTEREPHIGGALGAALLERCLAAGWIARLPKTRAVRVTDRGSRALRDVMGVDVASMR